MDNQYYLGWLQNKRTVAMHHVPELDRPSLQNKRTVAMHHVPELDRPSLMDSQGHRDGLKARPAMYFLASLIVQGLPIDHCLRRQRTKSDLTESQQSEIK